MSNNKNISQEELLAQIEALKAENAGLKEAQAASNTLTAKVSKKGGVSVYGLGRYPVTLYAEQWGRLFDHSDAIEDFIEARQDMLAEKGSPRDHGDSATSVTKTKLMANVDDDGDQS